MLKISRISYGATAAVVTSMALVAGLHAADANRASMVAALLISAIADNLTDSLSIHVYQESEHLPQREVLKGTASNFTARLVVCGSFVLIVGVLPAHAVLGAAVAWGYTLLVALTCLLARERRASVPAEVFKHVAMAAIVLLVSGRVGAWLASRLPA